MTEKHNDLNISTFNIQQWAKDRNLHTADPSKQMLKLMEEVGELSQGLAKDNQEQIVDSIGDIYVVLTILSLQLDLDIQLCARQAYNEIKDRKGQMVNGVFVKESDLT
ncbi:MazG-like family protein [Alkalibacillus salilacus]|uniref:NTP pyrophosphatase (Non-canonical NTP hydrolase) n=1 Tax=Alkalibacillus salilacus TaxID=284582 RepID=A0ABT9VDG7_9BACI|nr:MazG-like family protein [Alkalibacillus salilacus]MDQ0158984.1 NTP pyrophosphatase (non-canonical NTP hydrolase) [Alkalibacillus salilacus]